MPPSLTIGIVTYNAAAHLDGCLSTAAGQSGLRLRIAVVDNASSDGAADWLRDRRDIDELVLNDRNVGFGRAHNQLMGPLESDYYLALNPDVRLDPDYAARIIEQMESTDDIGWATGKLLGMDRAGQSTGRLYSAGHALMRDGFAFNIGQGARDEGQFDAGGEVFGANAAAAIYRRAFLEDLRLVEGAVFDEAMFLYFEDIDLDWRGQLLGWRCRYVPEAIGLHLGDYTQAGGHPRLVAQGLANRYRSVFKNAFGWDLLSYNLPRFLIHCGLRLAAQPRLGWIMLRPFQSGELGELVRARGQMARRRRVDRAHVMRWFAWSAAQSGSEGAGWIQRGRRFTGRAGLPGG